MDNQNFGAAIQSCEHNVNTELSKKSCGSARNLAIITGLLISKDRNADNIDIKRPILDFEVIFDMNGVSFEKIPVLLPGGALARSAAGCQVGGIYLVCGETRVVDGKVCVEAKRIALLSGEKKKQPLLVSRADLMKYTLSPNIASFMGTVKYVDGASGLVKVRRENMTQGDLTHEDDIPVLFPDDMEISEGATVLCTGQIQEDIVMLEDILVVSA